MVSPLDSVAVIGLVASYKVATGAPSTKHAPSRLSQTLPIPLLSVGVLGEKECLHLGAVQLLLADNGAPCISGPVVVGGPYCTGRTEAVVWM